MINRTIYFWCMFASYLWFLSSQFFGHIRLEHVGQNFEEKNNKIQNWAFVNFRWNCYIYALDYNIYALCHSAISQFRRAISTLSSSFLDTIWYTFSLDLEKKYYMQNDKWVTERNSKNKSWYIKKFKMILVFTRKKVFYPWIW